MAASDFVSVFPLARRFPVLECDPDEFSPNQGLQPAVAAQLEIAKSRDQPAA